jgi:hypothetical protein
MAELGPGAHIAGYTIESVAGQGGMGVVYRARDANLDRLVALKVIAPDLAKDEDFRGRFKRESRLAAAIEHPNVIPIYEAGESDGVLYISMRFVDGTDLRSVLQRQGRFEPVRAARFVAQVAAALDAAHAHGLVHRDVKPANVLLAADDHVYLTDFGLTKRAASESAMTKTGQFVGTVDYVAPEQVEGGRVDARTDVYALACVLYHLLTGQVPFDKPSEMAKLFAHVNEPPPAASDAVPGLPAELDDVIRRGMAKDPAERFQSAGDLGRAALAAAESRQVAEPERSVARGEAAPTELGSAPAAALAAAAPAPAPTRSRRPWLIGGGAAALVAIGVVVALVASGGGGGSSGGGSDAVPPGGGSTSLTLSSVPAPRRGETVLAAAQSNVQGVHYRVIVSIPSAKGPKHKIVPAYMTEYMGTPSPLKELHRIQIPYTFAKDSYVANLKVEANPAPNTDKSAGVALSWYVHTGDQGDLTHYFEATQHGIQVD